MCDTNENQSYSSSSKTAVSGGSSNREDLDEISDDVGQSFHRMSSQRRRRLWTLAARAGVKRNFQMDEYLNEREFCHTGKYLSSEMASYPPEEQLQGSYINQYAQQSTDRASKSTLIVVSPDTQKFQTKSPEIFEKNPSSSLLGVNVKDYVRRGNRSMKHQKSSTETSGLGSSLDWASTETLNMHTRALQQRNMAKNRFLATRKPDLFSDSLTPGHSPTSVVDYECINIGDYANLVSDIEQSPVLEHPTRMPRMSSDHDYYPRSLVGGGEETMPNYSNTLPHRYRQHTYNISDNIIRNPYKEFNTSLYVNNNNKKINNDLFTIDNRVISPKNHLLDRYHQKPDTSQFQDNPSQNNPLGTKSSVSRPLILGQHNQQMPLGPQNIYSGHHPKIIENPLIVRLPVVPLDNSNFIHRYMMDYGRPRNPKNYLQIPRMIGNSFDERLRERSPNSSNSDFERIPHHPEPEGYPYPYAQHYQQQNRPYLSRRAISLEKSDQYHQFMQQRGLIRQPGPSFNSPYVMDRNQVNYKTPMEDSNIHQLTTNQQQQHIYPKIMKAHQQFSNSNIYDSSSGPGLEKQSNIPNRFAVSYEEERNKLTGEERPRLCQSAGYVHFKSPVSESGNNSLNRLNINKTSIPNTIKIQSSQDERFDEGSISKVSKKKVSIISNEEARHQSDEIEKTDAVGSKSEEYRKNQSFSAPPMSGIEIGLSMKMNPIDMNRFAEYWDHAVFSQTRLWAVAVASISSIIITYALVSGYWLTSKSYKTCIGLWYNFDSSANSTYKMTLPFIHAVSSWKAGPACIILVVFFCGILGIVLSIVGQFVSSLPKQLYYFHSGGEVFFMSGVLIGLAQIIFYKSIPDNFNNLKLGIGFHICFSSVFLYLIASLLLLLDEVIHELSILSTKYSCFRKILICLLGSRKGHFVFLQSQQKIPHHKKSIRD